MKLELKFGIALCYTPIFIINGIEADKDDFGYQKDRDSENAGQFSCSDMHFTPSPPTGEILDKYNISLSEYYEIADQLESGLSFGNCSWCS